MSQMYDQCKLHYFFVCNMGTLKRAIKWLKAVFTQLFCPPIYFNAVLSFWIPVLEINGCLLKNDKGSVCTEYILVSWNFLHFAVNLGHFAVYCVQLETSNYKIGF